MEFFKIEVCVQVHIMQGGKSGMELFKIDVCVQVHIIQGGMSGMELFKMMFVFRYT